MAARALERAKIILGLAAGMAQQEIAAQLGIARQTRARWERRFRQQGIPGLEDAPRPGRPRVILSEKIEQIVRKTIQETSSDSTHWSTRSLAEQMEVSASSIGRIWRARDLKPHRVRTFKLSNDRCFAEKTDDVVNLCLPCAPSHCATKTSTYKRHGTTTLLAALNVHGGQDRVHVSAATPPSGMDPILEFD